MQLIVEIGRHIASNDHGEMNFIILALSQVPIIGVWVRSKVKTTHSNERES